MRARLLALWAKLKAWEARIRWASVGSAVVTLSGVLLDPAALNVVPEQYAKALIAVGSALQLVSHYVVRAPEDHV